MNLPNLHNKAYRVNDKSIIYLLDQQQYFKSLDSKYDLLIVNSPITEDEWNLIKSVSKNQIVWNGQSYNFLPPSMGWIIWEHDGGGEMAWTSFQRALRIFTLKISNGGFSKPYDLYEWVYRKYCKENNNIFVTDITPYDCFAAQKANVNIFGTALDISSFTQEPNVNLF